MSFTLTRRVFPLAGVPDGAENVGLVARAVIVKKLRRLHPVGAGVADDAVVVFSLIVLVDDFKSLLVTVCVAVVHNTCCAMPAGSYVDTAILPHIVSILSYIAFLVGTSVDPFHPAPYASSGTFISPVNVAPESSALSVLRAEKLALNFVISVQAGVSDVDIVWIVLILDRSSSCISRGKYSSVVVS